jgi:hypothetical protein
MGSAEVDQLELCPASGVFADPRKEKIEPWLWWGIFIHRFLEYYQTKGRDAALGYIRTKFRRGIDACEKIDVASIPAGEVEVALAHSMSSGVARRLAGRGRPEPTDETYGRADLLIVGGDRPHVVDYKTGSAEGVVPVGNPQLLGLAAAVASLLDHKDAVDASIVAVRNDGRLDWRTATYTPSELADFVDRQRGVHARMIEDRRAWMDGGVLPEFRPGEHCEKCGFGETCPSRAAKRQSPLTDAQI